VRLGHVPWLVTRHSTAPVSVFTFATWLSCVTAM